MGEKTNPGAVFKHKQCQNIATSEPETLNLEPFSLCAHGLVSNKRFALLGNFNQFI